jgi:uncharacterized protein (DUF2384 family)
MKVGRNDPCPCGSGKKYKKCCGLKEKEPDFALPEDMRTGTPLDEYMFLLQGVSLYHQMLTDYDDDKRELNRAAKDFERQFRPGTMDGVNDSLYMPWLFFDLRYGKSRKTVAERFLESDMIKQIHEPGLSLIRLMSDSYSTFYEVTAVSEQMITFFELGSGAEWNVHRVNEPEETDILKGDIWYVRFVGPRDDAYIFSAPYIFPPQLKDQFSLAVKRQKKIVDDEKRDGIAKGDTFAESCKQSLPLWAHFMLGADIEPHDEAPYEEEPLPGAMPALCNTDGEPLRFSKVVFKIIDNAGLKEKLMAMRALDYDEKNRTWIWFKKGNEEFSAFPTTSLGTIVIKRGRLVGETNSEERAIKLMNKLKRALKDLASFEKIEVKDLADLPPISESERRRLEKEQEELMKNPEVREAARRMAEHYYQNDWLNGPLPALGNQSPLDAINTPEGRRKVEALIDEIELMQRRHPDNAFSVDVEGLRRSLGFSLKKGE